jgi:hypothetical protein
MLTNEIGKGVEIPWSAWGGDRDEMSKVYGFDHQIQDRVEQETVMRERRASDGSVVADEVIRSVTGRRVKVKCDCRRWKGEERDEDGTGLKRVAEIRHGGYKDLPHR